MKILLRYRIAIKQFLFYSLFSSDRTNVFYLRSKGTFNVFFNMCWISLACSQVRRLFDSFREFRFIVQPIVPCVVSVSNCYNYERVAD